jgi:hypothetical protein
LEVFGKLHPVFDENAITNNRTYYSPNLTYRLLRTDEKKFI